MIILINKMKESKFFISCNCKTNYSFYPFLLPVLFTFIRIFHDKISAISKPERDSFKILKYNLPYLFYLYLPKVFSIILLPIINYNTRSENNESFLSLRKYHIFAKNKIRKKLLLLFYIISLFEVIQETGDFVLYYFQKTGQLGWLVEKRNGYIIFVPIFSIFILDKRLHRHHILALILGFIGAFIINLCRFTLKFSKTEEYKFHLLNILFSALSSFAIVLTKYTMSNYLIKSPYVFLFYDGIFCIINSFICILIEWQIVINIPDKNTKLEGENNHYFKNNFLEILTLFQGQKEKLKFYIYFFLSFIFSFFYYIINALTIYNFSPYFIILLEGLLPLDNDVIPYFFGEEVYRKEDAFKRTYIQLIGYVILFISALILDEAIILNFCGFNKNTFSRISLRAQLDSMRELSICSENDEDEKLNEA